MKSTIFIIMVLIASSAYGQRSQESKENAQARPKRSSTDIAELIFKRMDSNHNGSVSLKEFKAALPRLRESFTRGSQGPTRPTRPSQGRTRGFDGRTPSFHPGSPSRSRGRSRGRSK
tara:strand:- start:51314 stop:51664 length:351 start_codon:yes stop_codon:yes gene_type:complete